jgi:hypothetical protein
MREFLAFILSAEGQAVVQQHGIYLPLRSFQVEASRSHASILAQP